MRTIEINGKTVTLETGKSPEPTLFKRGTRPKSDFRKLLEAMIDGESVLLPITDPVKINRCSGIAANVGKVLGCRFAYRTENNGIRVFRMAGAVRSRSTNAAAKPNGSAQFTNAVGRN